jgi:hypothetical protein
MHEKLVYRYSHSSLDGCEKPEKLLFLAVSNAIDQRSNVSFVQRDECTGGINICLRRSILEYVGQVNGIVPVGWVGIRIRESQMLFIGGRSEAVEA